MDKKFGIIGFPLGHSFSKRYFDNFFIENSLTNHSFNNYELKDITAINQMISEVPNLCGFSVTIPYKEQIIPYLDKLDILAERVGAVNCVKVVKGQYSTTKIGYNTDVYGFVKSLELFLDDKRPSALVLGSGGASKAVCVGLDGLGISYKVVSRSPLLDQISYEDIAKDMLDNYKLVINTTPLGMYPKVEGKPNFPYNLITDDFYAYDLVYNPEHTAFMEEFSSRGSRVKSGFDMLIFQAEKAWEIYNND